MWCRQVSLQVEAALFLGVVEGFLPRASGDPLASTAVNQPSPVNNPRFYSRVAMLLASLCMPQKVRARAIMEAPQNRYSSLGDAVGGVHGGKYQFGPTSYTGSAFAEALASSSSLEDSCTRDPEDQAWPAWALRLKECSDVEASLCMVDGEANVEVSNLLRTWEPWYASFLLDADAVEAVPPAIIASTGFEVEPCSGTLAPRGGANNVCDATKPYRDSATITVRWRGAESLAQGARLLVKTEEAQWLFWLQSESP